MLQHLQKRKNEQGFTIIEVLIVLAIAALILVVVLIAIPNLQRSQRNSARKDEASRILTAANTVVSNNNGTPLTSANTSAILKEAGNLQQYGSLTAGSATTFQVGQLNVVSGATTAPSAPSGDGILVVTNATCDTANPGNTVAGTSSRQQVVVYTTEKGGGGYQALCLGS